MSQANDSGRGSISVLLTLGAMAFFPLYLIFEMQTLLLVIAVAALSGFSAIFFSLRKKESHSMKLVSFSWGYFFAANAFHFSLVVSGLTEILGLNLLSLYSTILFGVCGMVAGVLHLLYTLGVEIPANERV